ncbi:MAG: hypothetical protein RLZZ77_223 [Bacteroidota bacterium]
MQKSWGRSETIRKQRRYKRIILTVMKSSILLSLFIGMFLTAQSQSGTTAVIQIFGRVTELSLTDSSEKPMDGVNIEVWADDTLQMTLLTASKGKYRCALPYHKKYVLKYGGGGYIQKMVEIDAEGFLDQHKAASFTVSVDITLFKSNNLQDFDFLKQMPVAVATYRKKDNNVSWDEDHYRYMNGLIRAALTRIAEK